MCALRLRRDDAGTSHGKGGQKIMSLQVKNIESPEDKRSFEHGEVRTVCVGGVTIGRAVLNPGWSWSTDVKPLTGTDSCEVAHTAYILSGRMRVRMNDGTETELAAGDAHYVSPGHDAWVAGGEPCVVVDFTPAAARAGSALTGSKVTCHPCGVEFRIGQGDHIDHLIAAVQQHASGSHGHEVSREHILSELLPA
jgi:hypothetical protein